MVNVQVGINIRRPPLCVHVCLDVICACSQDMAGQGQRRREGNSGGMEMVAARRSSLPREKIPAPLLARSERPPTAPTRPRKVRSSNDFDR